MVYMKKILYYSICLLLLAAGCSRQTNNAPQPKEGAVVVSSPKSGDVVRQGFAQSVQWHYEKDENVSIAVCSNKGCDELAGNMPNSGEYKWGVTTVPGEGYYIEVYPVNDRSLSGRSAMFKIVESK